MKSCLPTLSERHLDFPELLAAVLAGKVQKVFSWARLPLAHDCPPFGQGG